MSRAARTFGPFFVFTGILHFAIPRVYEAIVPDALPAKRALVYASGVAEIAGGAGVLHARTRRRRHAAPASGLDRRRATPPCGAAQAAGWRYAGTPRCTRSCWRVIR